jgi:hypothetical protein
MREDLLSAKHPPSEIPPFLQVIGSQMSISSPINLPCSQKRATSPIKHTAISLASQLLMSGLCQTSVPFSKDSAGKLTRSMRQRVTFIFASRSSAWALTFCCTFDVIATLQCFTSATVYGCKSETRLLQLCNSFRSAFFVSHIPNLLFLRLFRVHNSPQ